MCIEVFRCSETVSQNKRDLKAASVVACLTAWDII
jgi:hypothetical protein